LRLKNGPMWRSKATEALRGLKWPDFGAPDLAEGGCLVYKAGLKKAKGFVRYYWLDTGKGEGASVSVFNDKAGADESIHLAADYVKDHMSKLINMKPEVIEGPVKAHD
jgi:hypothetical protein